MCAVHSLRRGPLWLLVVALSGLLITAARPAQNVRCFDTDAPEQLCINDRFLQFWEANGGLEVFGEPVTEAGIETTPDGAFTVQYFDKVRLELHPENSAPYDVLIGRLGAERMRETVRADSQPKGSPPEPGCRYFEQTGKAVCGPFLRFWRTNGLRFDADPAPSDAESLGLIGLPLSTSVIRVNEAGIVEETQWFERAGLMERDGVVVTLPVGRERARGSTGAPPSEIAQTPPDNSSPLPPESAPPPEGAPAPSPEPTPAGVALPTPAPPCNQDVPAPIVGLQLWVLRTPGDHDQAVACVRLILPQGPASGANAMVYRRWGDQTRSSNSQTTGKDGTASFIFYVGAGSPGMPERIDAVVTYNGVTYTTTVVPSQP